jgi:predicted nuclease of restriction endonuclease-like (RecB) superfamily
MIPGVILMPRRKPTHVQTSKTPYPVLLSRISSLLDQGRGAVVRATNAILTATYWEVGRHIVEYEQAGQARAEYGQELIDRLSADLTRRFGRGFGRSNLFQIRSFYLDWEIVQTPSGRFQAQVKCPDLSTGSAESKVQTLSGQFEAAPKRQTPSGKSGIPILQTPSGKSPAQGKEILQTVSANLQVPGTGHLPSNVPGSLLDVFPLSWSHYVRLMSVPDDLARSFYEHEAIHGAWSVRQLDRQIGTQFFQRTALSRNKEALLRKGRHAAPAAAVTPHELLRDPYVLEFLDLKDEYSENDLEEALIRHMETFLLELGAGFSFVARQKRIRIGSTWYRMDLVFFHRLLRCLVILDLKIEPFTHADAGQMNLYLNYAREHMVMPQENDPVGLILCSAKDDAVVHYAMGGIQAKVFASQYLTVLPDEETLRQEVIKTQKELSLRRTRPGRSRPTP